jgi:NADH-quinone oxidoreductase subunit L
MTFHGKERFVVGHASSHGAHHDDDSHHVPGHLDHAPHESPWVITLPLALLAIPSVIVGWFTVGPMLFGGWFGGAIRVSQEEGRDVLAEIGKEFHGPLAMVLHSFGPTSPFWPALAGFGVATYIWLFNPGVTERYKTALRPLYTMLNNKYWVDELYQAVFARGGIALGRAGRPRRRDRALAAVRLSLPLCLRHDPRPDRAARWRVVGQPPGTLIDGLTRPCISRIF